MLKGRDYFFIIVFSIVLSLITAFEYFTITYFSVLNFGQNQIALIFGLLFIAVVLGSFIYQFIAKIAIDRVSFSGPKNLVVHRLGYRYAPNFFLKNWLFLVDIWLKKIDSSDDEAKTYSLLLTNKALFLVDYFSLDNQIDLIFEKKIKTQKKEIVTYNSLLTDANFAYADKKDLQNSTDQERDLLLEVDQVPKFTLIDPQVKLASNEEATVTYLKQLNASFKVKDILQKRQSLVNLLKENFHLLEALTEETLLDFPIINVLLLESEEIKVQGEHPDFVICSEENFITKIQEINKLIDHVSPGEIRDIRKIIKKNI